MDKEARNKGKQRTSSAHAKKSFQIALLAIAVMAAQILGGTYAASPNLAQRILDEVVVLWKYMSLVGILMWLVALLVHGYRRILALVLGVMALLSSSPFYWRWEWIFLVKFFWVAAMAVFVAGQVRLVMGKRWSWPRMGHDGLQEWRVWMMGQVGHVQLTVILYVLSLVFVSYYLGDDLEPQGGGYVLLVYGWIGPILGYVSWLGNPFLILAILVRPGRPVLSLVLGILALAAMLSFLLYDEMIVNEGGGTRPIAAYGWGYVLWVCSGAVFVVGQALSMFRTDLGPRNKIILPLIPALMIVTAFAAWWLLNKDGPRAAELARERFMTSSCAKSELMMPNRPPEEVSSLYIDPDWSTRFEGIAGGHFQNYSMGIFAESLVRGRILRFVERRPYFKPKPGEPPYERVYLSDGRLKYEKIRELASEYSLIQETILPEEKAPDVYGKRVIVRDNRTGRAFASITYFVDRRFRRICIPYHPDGYFSVSRFAFDVLGLSKNRRN